MSFVEWSPQLSVDVSVIDTQHKKLIDLINQLHDAMKAGRSHDELGHTLSGLMEYVGHHFATEEKLMKETDYPDKAAHMAEHVKMTTLAKEYHERLTVGKTISGAEILGILRSWLMNHIQQVDAKLGKHLCEVDARKRRTVKV
ncbi:MAG: bacteriohemerythrin [Candidatus Zixiibacteriota bacterium]